MATTDRSDHGILSQLKDLENCIAMVGEMWRPDDESYRADVCRQIMMNLSFAYFVYFHADPEHPDWSPLWNPVYTDQPNPDDIYLYAPISGDHTYRVSGNRGTVWLLSFTMMDGMSGTVEPGARTKYHEDVDDRQLGLEPGADFEVVFSAERPSDYTGRWVPIGPDANMMMVRYRSVDWANERDPMLSIECLDSVPPKARLQPAEIYERLQEMARFPARRSERHVRQQNGIKDRVGVNHFESVRYSGGLSKQVYWPAVFELAEDEALIIETEMPDNCEYWNIQLNDPYFNTIEIVYRLSSLNAATARLSSDGCLRAVISLVDPGVPNWLDPAGFTEGTVFGRWYEASSHPDPTITRVPLHELRRHLPVDTPTVSAEQRAEELRTRVRAAQRRRRW